MDEHIACFKPLRWVAHLPLAILPYLAAVALEGPRLSRAVEQRVAAALTAAGQDWATVTARGQDVEIRGVATGAAAADAARAAAEATWGVRHVELRVGVRP